MDIMHLVTHMALLLYIFFILIAESTARPFTDLDTFISTPLDIERHFNDDYFIKYPYRSVAPKESLLNRLRRGYYYIEEGEITPVNSFDLNQNVQTARRRQDSFANEKSKKSKPKKLFVPNLFG